MDNTIKIYENYFKPLENKMFYLREIYKYREYGIDYHKYLTINSKIEDIVLCYMNMKKEYNEISENIINDITPR